MANNLDLTAEQELELLAALAAWWELWTAAGDAYGLERVALDARAAEMFKAQVARGGVFGAAWVTVQDTLSTWWELPELVREWVRTLPPTPATFAGRAVVALVDGE